MSLFACKCSANCWHFCSILLTTGMHMINSLRLCVCECACVKKDSGNCAALFFCCIIAVRSFCMSSEVLLVSLLARLCRLCTDAGVGLIHVIVVKSILADRRQPIPPSLDAHLKSEQHAKDLRSFGWQKTCDVAMFASSMRTAVHMKCTIQCRHASIHIAIFSPDV